MQSVARTSYDFGVVLADDPIVLMEDDILSEAECNHIIAATQGKLKPAGANSDDMGVTDVFRSASTCRLKHGTSGTIAAVIDRVADLVGIPARNAEELQVVHYPEGGEYHAHVDAYDLSTDRGVQRIAKGGQRIVSALLYLNTVENGGATGFPELGIEVPAIQGRLALFHNTLGETTMVNPRSEHGCAPVEVGEKWVCNLWFRQEAVQPSTAGRPRTPGRPVGRGKGKKRGKNKKQQRASRKKNR